MSRQKAFYIHLAISAAVAATAIAFMLLLWYAPPFFSSLGGKHVLLVLLGVNVSLGPLLTLIIFKPLKSRKALIFDLSAIAILQTAVLIYSMNVMFQSRPVYVVFSKDSFDLITADMLKEEDIAKAKNPIYRSLPLAGPVYVYSEMPVDIQERNDLVLSTMSGKDLPQFPQHYMPYDEHGSVAGQAAKPLAELKKLNPGSSADIENLIRASGRAESEIGFLPLRAQYRDQAVLVGKNDGKVLALLEVKLWPSSFLFNRDN